MYLDIGIKVAINLLLFSRTENPNSYLEILVNQEGFSTMLDTKVDLLPKDIQTEVEKMWRKEGWKGDKYVSVKISWRL